MTNTIEANAESISATAEGGRRQVRSTSRNTERHLGVETKTAANAAAAPPARPTTIRWLPKPIEVGLTGMSSKLMALKQIRLQQRHLIQRYPTRLEFLGPSQMAREMRRL